MKTILLIILSLLFISCGKKEIKKVKIDPAFQAQVEEFSQNARLAGNSVRIDNLVMEFVPSLDQYNTNGNVLGICYTSYREESDWLGNKKIYATPVIHIDRTDWDQLGSSGRKQLSFHELGHCVLDRPHSQSTASLMYPYHNAVQARFATYSGYNSMVYELFNPNKTVAAVGFQAINIASTMDDPNLGNTVVEDSLDKFAETNMHEDETGHIEHDESCHKIIKIESKEDF